MALHRKVEVYDKNYTHIATFSAGRSGYGDDALELMIDPTVEIEQNGNSTFEFSINITSEKWGIIKDPENIYIVDDREYTPLQEAAYTFQGDIVSVMAVESWYLLDRKFVQAYNVDPAIEGIDEHTVTLLPKSTNPLIVNGKERKNNPYPRGSAGYNLWAVLQDSGWTLGTCDVMVDGFSARDDYGVFNVETDMVSVLENIQKIQSLYGGILDFDSVHHVVNLRDEKKWNKDYGFEIRQGKNCEENPQIIQNNKIITRLYPMGESYLNIKAVNGNKTYLENFSYTDRVYSAILQNSDIYDQKQLKFWGERQLREKCHPTRTLNIELIDRRFEEGYETEVFDLNDIATIYYISPEGTEASEKQRIVSWKYNVFYPQKSEIECGNKERNQVEILKQSFDMGESASGKFNSSGYVSSGLVFVPDYYGGSYGWGGGNLSDYLVNNEQEIILAVEKVTETSDALAAFRVYADETYATAEALARYRTETTESIAALRLYADGISATASLVTQIVNADGTIKGASIVAAVNATSSSVKISADHINLEGITRFLNMNSPYGGGAIYWDSSGLHITGLNGVTMSYTRFPNGISVSSVLSNGHSAVTTSVGYKKSSNVNGTMIFNNGILTSVS